MISRTPASSRAYIAARNVRFCKARRPCRCVRRLTPKQHNLAVGKEGAVKLYDGTDTLGRTPGRLWIWVGAAWLDVSQTMYDMGHIKDPAAAPPPFCEPPPVP